MNDPMLSLPGLSSASGIPVVAKFDGGLLSSDGGILALRIGPTFRTAPCSRPMQESAPSGAAALAGTRLLRPAAGTAAGGRVRRVRGRGVQALLRAEDGRTVAAAGAVFPHAHDRLFRGDRQRARHRVALRGLVLAARFSAAVEPRQGPRSFVDVAHALASAA